jgi:hypothetical protein
VLETWRRDYNQERPHSKLGWMTPRDYVRALSGESDLLQHQPTKAQINLGLSLWLDEKRGSPHRPSFWSRRQVSSTQRSPRQPRPAFRFRPQGLTQDRILTGRKGRCPPPAFGGSSPLGEQLSAVIPPPWGRGIAYGGASEKEPERVSVCYPGSGYSFCLVPSFSIEQVLHTQVVR